MSLLRALVARLRALPPLVFDTGLAVLLLAEALLELFLITPITGVGRRADRGDARRHGRRRWPSGGACR